MGSVPSARLLTSRINNNLMALIIVRQSAAAATASGVAFANRLAGIDWALTRYTGPPFPGYRQG